MKVKASEIARMIRGKYDVITYARDVLGLTVYHDGDRCKSPIPTAKSEREDAFIVHQDWWYDFSLTLGGDVIELAALTRHNGDRGAAFRELGREFYVDINPASYVQHSKSLTQIINTWHQSLRPEDREYLHERRISDETIARLKIGYCGEKRSGMYDRIIIPYWRNGEVVYYAGRDCSGKWKDKGTGVSKYKKMWTGKNEFSENIMWGLHTLSRRDLRDPVKRRYLCILEGMFDAMSFEQEGWSVLSPIGGHFSGKLMPLVKSIAREFETVFICFDNDGPGVSFQRAMAKFLFESNIPFVCGHVQGTYMGKPIKDVSDYYAMGGDLTGLVTEATEGLTELAGTFQAGSEREFLEFMKRVGRYADMASVVRLAKIVAGQMDSDYVKECLKIAKKPPLESEMADEILKEHNLLYMVGDGFYEYEHGVWNMKPNLAVQEYAGKKLGNYALSGRMISLERHIAAKRWNGGQMNTQNILNVMNGVVDLTTLEVSQHAPGYMSSIQIPHVYDPEAECTRWEKVVGEIMGGDSQKIRLLKQICGYLTWPDNRMERAFFFMGEGSNGKSVIIETLRYVLDPRNCSNVDLSKMGDQFAPMALKNSLVNFCTETRVDLKGSEAAIKQIISGETIMAAHKGIDAVSFAPRCKLVCACNNFIPSKDISFGFVRRLKFIDFNQTFTGSDADKGLKTALRDEASGILNWCIAGAQDLRRMGDFVETEEESRIREEFLMIANPLAGFIRMELESYTGLMTGSELYEKYCEWTKKSNTGTLSVIQFGRLFSGLIKQMRPEVVRGNAHGKTTYRFPVKGATPDSWE